MNIFLEKVSSCVWGGGLIFLLLFTGIIYTIKLGLIQFRMIPFLVKNSRKDKNKNSGISQFKTVCMSLGTAMGTGNITGVAAAVSIGGAGAVFWMWISAFLGMAIVYAENSLSVIYSSKEERGPMAYLEKGLGSRLLASVFAFMCIAACFGMGGMVQVSSFIDSLGNCINLNRNIAAIASFMLIYIVISGGASRIGIAAQALLPIASVIYAIVSAIVLIKYKEHIPVVFKDIFLQAFGIRQAVGGTAGYTLSKAVSIGIRRGIFSNEAGLGSSPILHSAAESNSPQLQGMWSMFEVFFDTIICCSLTAFVILCAAPDFSLNTAFSTVLGKGTPLFLSVEMAVFAFCTIIGWYYCGETAYRYISKKTSCKKLCIIFAAASSMGAILHLQTIWTLSDIFNGLMAIPNLLGLLLLIKKVRKE